MDHFYCAICQAQKSEVNCQNFSEPRFTSNTTHPAVSSVMSGFILWTVFLSSHGIDIRDWLPCSFWHDRMGDKPDIKKESSKSFPGEKQISGVS